MTLPHRLTAAALGAGLALLATGCGGDGDPQATDTTSATSSDPTSTAPSSGSSGSSSDPGSGASGGSVDPVPGAVAVYDVGSTPLGPRLYREFRSSTTTDAGAAAVQMLTDAPTDPDYRTLWPAGALSAVTVAQGQIDVVVDPSLAQRPAGLSAAEAQLALQQVVYTLDGAVQQRLPVRFLIGDAPAATVLGVPTGDPVAAADQLETLALVNLTTPEQGQRVTGSFVASGVASAFEGTVPWSVLDADGTRVLHGVATSTFDPTALTPWQVTVDVGSLPAGAYTFVAASGDAGGEGPGPTKDTKAFTVS